MKVQAVSLASSQQHICGCIRGYLVYVALLNTSSRKNKFQFVMQDRMLNSMFTQTSYWTMSRKQGKLFMEVGVETQIFLNQLQNNKGWVLKIVVWRRRSHKPFGNAEFTWKEIPHLCCRRGALVPQRVYLKGRVPRFAERKTVGCDISWTFTKFYISEKRCTASFPKANAIRKRQELKVENKHVTM